MEAEAIERANVARLTEKQRQCMHLVVLRKSSKEIARELQIAKPTVDQRIASARHILGAKNRDEAAIIFARATQTYDRIIYDAARIPSTIALLDTSQQEVRPNIGLTLNEPALIPFSGVLEHQDFERSSLSWSPSVDMGTLNRVAIMFGLTVGILSVVLVGLSVAQSLSRMLAAS
ncbi:MAG: helix-turn-helix transcriptional regulator [Sphingorhabdus sp.]|jgi:DNA-binding CsgD family transcriptional regulator|uniref:helix-turn-helix domain-containing protein n=1 Tax=Sphingorhabdus sp. TaxID=1902408 RepID=UPI0025CBFF75|nr:helix-turn-helix transcriptional regulator [Sphingorhabdus sp.]MCO4091535.1 helix-turn-helix transcriptional regulator [Sphingorhabdus sp.]